MRILKKQRVPHTEFEQPFRSQGLFVAGVDEAGRGALAGPVVAAAVILPADCHAIDGVRDSKQLSETRRENLFDVVTDIALSVGVGIIENEIIDEVNILQATFLAMHKAIAGLNPQPHHLLIDGNRFPAANIPATTLVDGDAIALSIAAASIIAKVTRDRIMRELNEQFPNYAFAKHKGYATAQHRKAILLLGETAIHRKTFLNKLYNAQKILLHDKQAGKIA